jgi:hypothetical protein
VELDPDAVSAAEGDLHLLNEGLQGRFPAALVDRLEQYAHKDIIITDGKGSQMKNPS